MSKKRLYRTIFHWSAIGMAVHLALMAQAYLSASSISYFGVSDQQVTDTIWRDYTGVIMTMLSRVTISHLLLGAVMGTLAGRIVRLAGSDSKVRRKPFPATLGIALMVLFLHSALLAANMARYPQFYVEPFYARGGLGALVQKVVCSDAWPLPTSIDVLLAVVGSWLLLELRLVIRERLAVSRAGGFAFATLVSAAMIVTLYFPETGYWQNAGARADSIRPGEGPDHSPNLLIIAVDSLRADRLFTDRSQPRQVAPVLSRLAKEGLGFSRVYSVLPRTFPSWISMLTGLYPVNHHIFHMFPTLKDRVSLPPAVPQLLVDKGYTTAVVTDFAGDIFSRVDLGFQQIQAPYFHFPTVIRQRILELDYHLLPYVVNPIGRRLFPVIKEIAYNADPELLTDQALSTISRLPEPWMLLVFYSTAHFPYAAPAPYYRMFADPDYQGPFKYHKPHDLVEQIGTAADIQQARDIYDGAVRAVDDQIGRLLESLETKNDILNRTVTVITADHGENLYDGNMGMGHGDHLYGEDSVRIPLIFWNPNGLVPARTTNETVIANIDLAPTLLDIAGVKPEDRPQMNGISLKPCWESGSESGNSIRTGQGERCEQRPVLLESGLWFSDMKNDIHLQGRIPYPPLTNLVEIDRGTNHEVTLKDMYAPVVQIAKHRALYQDGKKLMYIPTVNGVQWQMFDPVADPMNTHDLIHEEQETAARLKKRLLSLVRRDSSAHYTNEYLNPDRPEQRPARPLPHPRWLDRLRKTDVLQP